MRTAILLTGLLLTLVLVATPSATATQCVSTIPDVTSTCNTALDTARGGVNLALGTADCLYYTAPAYWDQCA